jgi:hypothetical protein
VPEGKTERMTGMAALSYRNQDSGYSTVVGNLSDSNATVAAWPGGWRTLISMRHPSARRWNCNGRPQWLAEVPGTCLRSWLYLPNSPVGNVLYYCSISFLDGDLLLSSCLLQETYSDSDAIV